MRSKTEQRKQACMRIINAARHALHEISYAEMDAALVFDPELMENVAIAKAALHHCADRAKELDEDGH